MLKLISLSKNHLLTILLLIIISYPGYSKSSDVDFELFNEAFFNQASQKNNLMSYEKLELYVWLHENITVPNLSKNPIAADREEIIRRLIVGPIKGVWGNNAKRVFLNAFNDPSINLNVSAKDDIVSNLFNIVVGPKAEHYAHRMNHELKGFVKENGKEILKKAFDLYNRNDATGAAFRSHMYNADGSRSLAFFDLPMDFNLKSSEIIDRLPHSRQMELTTLEPLKKLLAEYFKANDEKNTERTAVLKDELKKEMEKLYGDSSEKALTQLAENLTTDAFLALCEKDPNASDCVDSETRAMQSTFKILGTVTSLLNPGRSKEINNAVNITVQGFEVLGILRKADFEFDNISIEDMSSIVSFGSFVIQSIGSKKDDSSAQTYKLLMAIYNQIIQLRKDLIGMHLETQSKLDHIISVLAKLSEVVREIHDSQLNNDLLINERLKNVKTQLLEIGSKIDAMRFYTYTVYNKSSWSLFNQALTSCISYEPAFKINGSATDLHASKISECLAKYKTFYAIDSSNLQYMGTTHDNLKDVLQNNDFADLGNYLQLKINQLLSVQTNYDFINIQVWLEGFKSKIDYLEHVLKIKHPHSFLLSSDEIKEGISLGINYLVSLERLFSAVTFNKISEQLTLSIDSSIEKIKALHLEVENSISGHDKNTFSLYDYAKLRMDIDKLNITDKDKARDLLRSGGIENGMYTSQVQGYSFYTFHLTAKDADSPLRDPKDILFNRQKTVEEIEAIHPTGSLARRMLGLSHCHVPKKDKDIRFCGLNITKAADTVASRDLSQMRTSYLSENIERAFKLGLIKIRYKLDKDTLRFHRKVEPYNLVNSADYSFIQNKPLIVYRNCSYHDIEIHNNTGVVLGLIKNGHWNCTMGLDHVGNRNEENIQKESYASSWLSIGESIQAVRPHKRFDAKLVLFNTNWENNDPQKKNYYSNFTCDARIFSITDEARQRIASEGHSIENYPSDTLQDLSRRCVQLSHHYAEQTLPQWQAVESEIAKLVYSHMEDQLKIFNTLFSEKILQVSQNDKLLFSKTQELVSLTQYLVEKNQTYGMPLKPESFVSLMKTFDIYAESNLSKKSDIELSPGVLRSENLVKELIYLRESLVPKVLAMSNNTIGGSGYSPVACAGLDIETPTFKIQSMPQVKQLIDRSCGFLRGYQILNQTN